MDWWQIVSWTWISLQNLINQTKCNCGFYYMTLLLTFLMSLASGAGHQASSAIASKHCFNMQYFEKGHLSCRESKKFFFCFSWGMKALMPTSQNPWSDLFHLLNSWHYSHPKFKIVNIEVNFWEGPPQLF